MKTILKFEVYSFTTFEMPKDAQILSVATQDDRVFIWVLVDTSNELEPRHFRAFGTGHEIPTDTKLEFLGTAHLQNPNMVFHIFEELKNETKPEQFPEGARVIFNTNLTRDALFTPGEKHTGTVIENVFVDDKYGVVVKLDTGQELMFTPDGKYWYHDEQPSLSRE